MFLFTDIVHWSEKEDSSFRIKGTTGRERGIDIQEVQLQVTSRYIALCMYVVAVCLIYSQFDLGTCCCQRQVLQIQRSESWKNKSVQKNVLGVFSDTFLFYFNRYILSGWFNLQASSFQFLSLGEKQHPTSWILFPNIQFVCQIHFYARRITRTFLVLIDKQLLPYYAYILYTCVILSVYVVAHY